MRPEAAANISGVCPHCRLADIHAGAGIEQDRDGLAAARRGRKVKRRRSGRGQRADVGLRADEKAKDSIVAAFGGDVERLVLANARPAPGLAPALRSSAVSS